MVRILVLKRMYDLSDEQMECQLLDRMGYKRFCVLAQATTIPDRATVWTFENRIGEAVGASQDSCRLNHAANCVLFSAFRSRMTASRSGLSVTAPIGDQLRVFPDQRAGLPSRAWRYV